MLPLLKISLLLCIGASLAYRRRLQTRRDYIFRPDGRVECLASIISPSVGAGSTPSNSDPHDLAQSLEVDAASQLLGRLMVVRFRHAPVRASLILLPDSFNSPDDYRRVRIWLKWQGGDDYLDAKNGLAGGAQDGV